MSNTLTLVLGTGPQALYAAMILQRNDRTIGGFLSEKEDLIGQTIADIPVLGTCQVEEMEVKWKEENYDCFVAVSPPTLQEALCELLRERLCNAIDPSVAIGPGVKMGQNLLIEPGVLIGPGLEIRDNCWVQAHSRLAADAVLASDVIIGACVTLSEEVEVKKAAHIGAHSYVAPRLKIGEAAQVAPLSRILEDVESNLHVH